MYESVSPLFSPTRTWFSAWNQSSWSWSARAMCWSSVIRPSCAACSPTSWTRVQVRCMNRKLIQSETAPVLEIYLLSPLKWLFLGRLLVTDWCRKACFDSGSCDLYVLVQTPQNNISETSKADIYCRFKTNIYRTTFLKESNKKASVHQRALTECLLAKASRMLERFLKKLVGSPQGTLSANCLSGSAGKGF